MEVDGMPPGMTMFLFIQRILFTVYKAHKLELGPLEWWKSIWNTTSRRSVSGRTKRLFNCSRG